LSSSPVNKIIYAPNVHQGGGKTLLLPILSVLKDRKNILFILDERLQLHDSFIFSGKVMKARPTLASRLLLECHLWYLVKAETNLLCMGSLPPLWARSNHIVVFVQNRYLVEDVSLSGFSLPVRLRIRIERWWLKARAARVAHFIVQTQTMRGLLRNKLWRDTDILPYFSFPEVENQKSSIIEKKYDFLYVASGEPHKNRRCLIESWIILAQRGEFPSLCLILDAKKFPDLCTWINDKRLQHSLQVEILGKTTHQDIQQLYYGAKALIYPSFFESFGLPLLEAALAGLPIIASDVDYVHDLIEPSSVFDPHSPESIADAVSNFSFTPTNLVQHPLDTESFLANALDDTLSS